MILVSTIQFPYMPDLVAFKKDRHSNTDWKLDKNGHHSVMSIAFTGIKIYIYIISPIGVYHRFFGKIACHSDVI